jgi:ribonuclease R
MDDFTQQILAAVAKKGYEPLKPKALARHLHVPSERYNDFRKALRDLLKQGRVEKGKNHLIRAPRGHGAVAGIYRKTSSGTGFVRPHAIDGHAGEEIRIHPEDSRDAATGDEVLVQIRRKARGDSYAVGRIVEVLERATHQFVGTYFERDGQGLVRVDGAVFAHSVYVGDPGAKGVRPEDKVVLEMLRFPTAEERGEGVITEVLGPRGAPGVDLLSTIRAFDLPDKFPEPVLEEARARAAAFREDDLAGREDFTGDLVITIDPADARDFDDAVSLVIDPKSKHWRLGVHIADVAHFAPPGSELDREARKRATSVYLPQRVLPMFPEVISNGVASLQPDRVRYVKSVHIDFTPAGQKTAAEFANGAIRSRRRFTYEQVSAILNANPPHPPAPSPTKGRGGERHHDTDAGAGASSLPPLPSVGEGGRGVRGAEGGEGAAVEPEITAMLLRMRDLAMLLRKRRLKRGALELEMPEAELEYDEHGRVSGAHFVKRDVSHQVIEEFMLAANEAVAEQFADLDVPFLRRVHPAPEPNKLKAFAEFARSLDYKLERDTDRFALQRVLKQSAGKPDMYAVHYALLRSLKQAVYSPLEEGHYALASDNYCHFTSPIRRYPDLTVHRLLGQWLRTGKAGSDEAELAALGEHCSKMERRAEMAERELIKARLLDYMSKRIGLELEVVISGVADYGFFAQAEKLPIEGLVHISTLTDDYYYYDETTHSLTGRKTKRRYRLGDKVKVTVVRVDLQRRQLDFRVVPKKKEGRSGTA